MTVEPVTSTIQVLGIAPQFLVDDLKTAIAYYCDKLGFDLDFCYESFYASVSRNGFAIHLKCAPKTVSDRTHRKQHEHLDAYISVTGVAALHDELASRGALITKPLEEGRGPVKTSTSRTPTDTFSASANQRLTHPCRSAERVRLSGLNVGRHKLVYFKDAS